jgi:hypothetical protein
MITNTEPNFKAALKNPPKSPEDYLQTLENFLEIVRCE